MGPRTVSLRFPPHSSCSFSSISILGLLFSSLIGSTILSGLIITPALLVHFFWYKPNPTEHRRYVRDNIDAWLFWAASNVSVSWFLALLVDIVPVIARYVIMAAWGHVSERIKNRIEMYNSVKDAIKPVFSFVPFLTQVDRSILSDIGKVESRSKVVLGALMERVVC